MKEMHIHISQGIGAMYVQNDRDRLTAFFCEKNENEI